MAKNNQRELPIEMIHPNPAALREVDTKTEDFLSMVESVKNVGIISPIAVREMKNNDTGSTYYSLIDGLHRWTASREAGLETIPCHIITASEAQALEIQIIGNLHTIETKPVQYAKALIRLLAYNPALSLLELAKNLSKSEAWLRARLGLEKLDDPIQKLVDEGAIIVTNAQVLSKLPKEEQSDYVDRAVSMTPQQFGSLVTERIKDIRDAKRQGRAPTPKQFQPQPYLQKFSVFRDEMDNPNIGKSVLHTNGITDAVAAWQFAMKWSLHMDPQSIEVQFQEDQLRQKKNEEAKEARKKEREDKKRTAGAEAQASVLV